MALQIADDFTSEASGSNTNQDPSQKVMGDSWSDRLDGSVEFHFYFVQVLRLTLQPAVFLRHSYAFSTPFHRRSLLSLRL